MNITLKKFLLTTALLLPISLQCEELTIKKNTLYFGVPMNYPPYVFLNKKEETKGLLVDSIKSLCVEIDQECVFIRGSFHQLLNRLEALEIHSLLVIDSVLLPDIDKVLHSQPLCKINPVFIQQIKDGKPFYKSPEDLEKTTIGVLVDSLFHLYLLDNYYSSASIRPYNLLESGLFDLVSGRIDSLFAEQTFFKERVAKTSLTKVFNVQAKVIGDVAFNQPSMSLVLRKNSPDLLAALNAAIQKRGATDDCARMIYNRADTGAR